MEELPEGFTFLNSELTTLEHEAETDLSTGMSPNFTKTRCNFTWTLHGVRDFNMVYGEQVSSPAFKSEEIGDSKWKLRFFPCGCDEKDKNFVCVFLDNLSENDNQYRVGMAITLSAEGEQLYSMKAVDRLKRNESSKAHSYKTLHDIFKKGFTTWPKILVLNVNMTVSVYGAATICTSYQEAGSIQHVPDRMALANDMINLLKSKRFSDVTLQVGTYKIEAHKNVLSARCPVFSRMFEHQMRENITDTVVIEDVELKTMVRFVGYLYSNSAGHLSAESAIGLYKVADKYGVESLRKQCSKFLESSLTVESALDVLLLSDLHDDRDLKAAALRMISENVGKISSMADWKEKLKERPLLAIEILMSAEK